MWGVGRGAVLGLELCKAQSLEDSSSHLRIITSRSMKVYQQPPCRRVRGLGESLGVRPGTGWMSVASSAGQSPSCFPAWLQKTRKEDEDWPVSCMGSSHTLPPAGLHLLPGLGTDRGGREPRLPACWGVRGGRSVLPPLLARTLASRASASGQHWEANSFPQSAANSPVGKKNSNSNFKFCN